MKYKSIKKIVSSLKKSPRVLSDFVHSMEDNALDRKRGDGVWTVREHLYHLAKVQPLLYERLELFKEQEHPEILPYFPSKEGIEEGEEFQDIKDALAEFKNCRKKQIKFIKKLKQKDFEKKGSHSQYTHYDLPILLRHYLLHDYWHMYRMEDIWLCKDEFFEDIPQ